MGIWELKFGEGKEQKERSVYDEVTDAQKKLKEEGKIEIGNKYYEDAIVMAEAVTGETIEFKGIESVNGNNEYAYESGGRRFVVKGAVDAYFLAVKLVNEVRKDSKENS